MKKKVGVAIRRFCGSFAGKFMPSLFFPFRLFTTAGFFFLQTDRQAIYLPTGDLLGYLQDTILFRFIFFLTFL
jgi:hypothetical protein